MTFNTALKEEISKTDLGQMEARCELEAFIKCFAKISNSSILMALENAAVARKIYKDIKNVFNINPTVKIRIQKRFRVKQIYILTISEKLNFIKESLNINNYNFRLDSNEERIAFLQGAFLAIGNISNPSTSGYHLEFICSNSKIAKMIQKVLISLNIPTKIIERGYKMIVYNKSGENISDIIKMFKATNSLFYFEDIRIYRDHKNMVNRLNNCEISNQTKAIETGLKQLKIIKYIKDNKLDHILDSKTLIVMEARNKYPETSLSELSEIITEEYNYKIGKSGVNHHFIKMEELVKRHKDKNEN